MAKSWGARIVGRLFGSRSNKKTDAEVNETPNLEDQVKDGLLQHDPDLHEELPTKDSEKGLNQFEPESSEEAAPIEESSKAELNVGKPNNLEMPTLSIEPAKANAGEPSTPLSNSAPMQRPSPVRVPISQNGPLHDKPSGLGAGPLTDEAFDGKSIVSNSGRKRKRDHGAQRKVANEVPTKGPGKADSKVHTDVKPDDRAEIIVSANDTIAAKKPSSHGGSLKFVQGKERKSAAPIAPISSLKRSRKQKPKAMDEQVTDKELAELEAENARLKLLLREKL